MRLLCVGKDQKEVKTIVFTELGLGSSANGRREDSPGLGSMKTIVGETPEGSEVIKMIVGMTS